MTFTRQSLSELEGTRQSNVRVIEINASFGSITRGISQNRHSIQSRKTVHECLIRECGESPSATLWRKL